MERRYIMKIIDFEKKGNVIHFYLGKNDLEKWWGDDWDDTPYEHNAGEVYDKYVEAWVDIVFPFNWEVCEPADDWNYNGNSPYCKDDFKARQAPCIIAIPPEVVKEHWDVQYSTHVGDERCIKFYFGDEIDVPEYNMIYLYEKQTDNYNLIQKFGLI